MVETKIKIGDNELSVLKINLKGWTLLESKRKLMEDAVSKKDYKEYFHATVQFIETASFPVIDWSQVPWYETLEVYSKIVEINKPSIDFPVLHGGEETKEKLPWEYDGRTWYFWLNLFAKNYGWTENQIEHLDIDTAIGLYQEIELGSQLSKEWQWGLTELSYKYDKTSKTSTFQPLPRPSWMKPMIPKHLPVMLIRKDMMPIGNIIDMQNGSKTT